jgi:hypothetical protein
MVCNGVTCGHRGAVLPWSALPPKADITAFELADS